MDKKTVTIIILSCIVVVLLTIIVAWSIISRKQYEDLRLKYEELCKITDGIVGNVDDIGSHITTSEELSGSIETEVSGAIEIGREVGRDLDRAEQLNREAQEIIDRLKRETSNCP